MRRLRVLAAVAVLVPAVAFAQDVRSPSLTLQDGCCPSFS
jgi:hypothetical protein